MQRIEKSVFISYRRTNAAWALAIFHNLTHHGYDVFFDFNGLASGDFEQSILENIHSRAHFIVLLTPSALERCAEPTDWLRREIEAALESRRNIVPLMLEGFSFATPEIGARLTGKLAQLKSYNALHVPAEYFDAAMERLRHRYLSVPLDAVLHPVSAAAREVTKDQQAKASASAPVVERELTAEEWFERGSLTTNADTLMNYYNEAIRLKPDYAFAYNSRGNVRDAKGDLEGALQDYSEAIRINPRSAYPFHNRGNVREAKGDLEGALQDYNEAIRLKPDFAYSLNSRGLVRCTKGDWRGGLQDFNQAIRFEPSFANAYRNRGMVRHSEGDLEGALEDYNEAIRLKPDYASAIGARARVITEMNERIASRR